MKQSQYKAISPARQLHLANGIPTCCSVVARGTSAFGGRFEPVDDVVSLVAIADKRGKRGGGDDDGRTEADPAVKKITAANVMDMRRREFWKSIL